MKAFPPEGEKRTKADRLLKDSEMGKKSGGKTIFLIEDEVMVSEVCTMMLEELGHFVILAKNGAEALNVVKTYKGDIDLAILDIGLPDMRGDRLYPEMLKERPKMKVVVASGYAMDNLAQAILKAGAHSFIQKPYSMATLASKLKELFKKN